MYDKNRIRTERTFTFHEQDSANAMRRIQDTTSNHEAMSEMRLPDAAANSFDKYAGTASGDSTACPIGRHAAGRGQFLLVLG